VGKLTEVKIPDIGDFDEVDVIEVLVKAGDQIAVEDPLITLESDKATMDVPSPTEGVVSEVRVKVGDKVSEGKVVVVVEGESTEQASSPEPKAAAAPEDPSERKPAAKEPSEPTDTPEAAPAADAAPKASRQQSPPPGDAGDEDEPPGAAPPSSHAPPPTLPPPAERAGVTPPHASPAIRRFARELGVDLAQIRGSGAKGRILKEDVQQFVKAALSSGTGATAAPAKAGSIGIPPIPEIDFSRFGEIETVALGRIKRISGPHLHRAWLNVPHVTHHDEADITELEAFRKAIKTESEKQGARVTVLAFILKALAATLREFPNFNASLAPDGQSLILKKYCHLGMAVDTPNGLVVPVIRDVDTLGILDLARAMADISAKARDGKLSPSDLQGGCMSVSSLGGIGGTAFTPIINAPEVAILGVVRARMTPVWNGSEFRPRLMLPLDLSYDHRVVDGAESARFVSHLCGLLGDVRRLLL